MINPIWEKNLRDKHLYIDYNQSPIQEKQVRYHRKLPYSAFF